MSHIDHNGDHDRIIEPDWASLGITTDRDSVLMGRAKDPNDPADKFELHIHREGICVRLLLRMDDFMALAEAMEATITDVLDGRNGPSGQG